MHRKSSKKPGQQSSLFSNFCFFLGVRTISLAVHVNSTDLRAEFPYIHAGLFFIIISIIIRQQHKIV